MMNNAVNEGKNKLRLLFDFDGVIHSYTSGWHGVDLAIDKPVKGVKECIDQLKDSGKFEIVIYSSRCTHEEGVQCIKDYCAEYGIYYDEIILPIPYPIISSKKKAAYLTIDDRAICFDGDGEGLLEKIKKFKPWTQLDK